MSERLVEFSKVLEFFGLDQDTVGAWATKGYIIPTTINEPDGETKDWTGFSETELIVLALVSEQSRIPDHLNLFEQARDTRFKLAEIGPNATPAARDHQAKFLAAARATLAPLLAQSPGDERSIAGARRKRYLIRELADDLAAQAASRKYNDNLRELRISALEKELAELRGGPPAPAEKVGLGLVGKIRRAAAGK